MRVFRSGARPADPTQIAQFSRLRYQALYPGITLTYQNARGNLQSIYTVAPAGDPSQIRWRYDGAGSVRVDAATGRLQVSRPGDAQRILFTEHRPVAWQRTAKGRVAVPVRYAVDAAGWVSFVLGDYNHALPLIIDPVLTSGSYVGGTGDDEGDAIAVDASGNIYVAFTTDSADLLSVTPLYGPSTGTCTNYFDYCTDILVAKFSPDGQTMLAATYLGGSGRDTASDIAIGADGRVYVLGSTDSADFPVVNALQSTLQTAWPYDGDAVLAVLNANLSAVDYATYLGGTGDDLGESLSCRCCWRCVRDGKNRCG